MLKVVPTAAMSDALTGTTYYHAQLGLLDKGFAICYV